MLFIQNKNQEGYSNKQAYWAKKVFRSFIHETVQLVSMI